MFILKKKIFFSRTSRLISIKLGINHPWVKGILNCSNKGLQVLFKREMQKRCKIDLIHGIVLRFQNEALGARRYRF
jgi:hypothetical protein